MRRKIVEKEKKTAKSGNSFRSGAVALAFMIIGYQIALFVRESARVRIIANHDSPDTVFVYIREQEEAGTGVLAMADSVVRPRELPVEVEAVLKSSGKLEAESFAFNPNTVSVEDLRRLGFSEKQALSIDNYRKKGGHFNRKEDFGKSFVVSEETFQRLEPFIEIPLVNINKADSAAFDALPGIGPYYAAKMVEYREQLGGYTSVEQLLGIWNFGQERFDALKDLICVD